MLYGAGSCIWRRIYQSNFHNIKNQFSAQALGLKPGVLWPASAWFGPILCSNAQAHYAGALAQILNLSISTGIPTSPKILGKCSGCRIQKWLHATVVWIALWGPFCDKEIRQRADGETHAHAHNTLRFGKWLIIPSVSVSSMKQCKGTPYDGTGHKVNSDAFAIRNLFIYLFF